MPGGKKCAEELDGTGVRILHGQAAWLSARPTVWSLLAVRHVQEPPPSHLLSLNYSPQRRFCSAWFSDLRIELNP
jgi:hypothetical protein